MLLELDTKWKSHSFVFYPDTNKCHREAATYEWKQSEWGKDEEEYKGEKEYRRGCGWKMVESSLGKIFLNPIFFSPALQKKETVPTTSSELTFLPFL